MTSSTLNAKSIMDIDQHKLKAVTNILHCVSSCSVLNLFAHNVPGAGQGPSEGYGAQTPHPSGPLGAETLATPQPPRQRSSVRAPAAEKPVGVIANPLGSQIA